VLSADAGLLVIISINYIPLRLPFYSPYARNDEPDNGIRRPK